MLRCFLNPAVEQSDQIWTLISFKRYGKLCSNRRNKVRGIRRFKINKFIKHFWTSKPVELSKLSRIFSTLPRKSLESEKECSSSDKVFPHLSHKIIPKLQKFYWAGFSELDVIQKSITVQNKRTVYHYFQKLKQIGTSLRKSCSGKRCKLTLCINKILLRSLNLIIFLL